MEQRQTCITGIWLRLEGGRIQVLVQQAGGWYAVIDEGIDVISHKMTALAIDRKVDEIEDDRLLAEVAQIGVQQAQGAP